ncbi:CLUMA_CG017905, isoform A [Clunio marinus]|uniref:CLUMA_CG017905, isoform A n=1 Tax=Clunio marinus TaxID=568069 RepID=A0A1J1IZ85_9DIPT|nr:CLUMA_CG017905, isoform A [Clunio marinus]
MDYFTFSFHYNDILHDLSSTCRFCLRKAENHSILLFEVTESSIKNFEELTQTKLFNIDAQGDLICGECSGQLENFYLFKQQLILKQNQLKEMIDKVCNSINLMDQQEDNTEIFYEKLIEEDEDDDLMNFNFLPSVKDLEDTSDNDAIIKLIDDIQERNEMILESSKPNVKLNDKKHSKSSCKKSNEKVSEPVTRNEELKFTKQLPKLIIKPVLFEDETSVETGGIVLFSQNELCSICGLQFPSDYQLKRHLRTSHPLEQPLECCNRIFKFLKDYKKHQMTDHPKAIECLICGKILKSQKTFIVHKKSHQSLSERKFRCSHADCHKAFNFKLHLENHERTHTGDKPFKCKQCEASFKQSYQLTLHIRKHQGIIHECSKCKLKFSLKSQLDKHTKVCNKEITGKKRFRTINKIDEI